MDNLIEPNFYVGMPVTQVLMEILKINPEMSSLSFYVYKPHKNVGDSFERLLFHDQSQISFELERDKLDMASLAESIDSLQAAEKALGFLSTTKIKGRTYHIPMIDFSCAISQTNLAEIKKFLLLIGQKRGVVLNSGRSYHYYGANPMNGKQWLNFLGDCLLSELVDKRYIGHRCKDGCGILRISACTLRPGEPKVVLVLNEKD